MTDIDDKQRGIGPEARALNRNLQGQRRIPMRINLMPRPGRRQMGQPDLPYEEPTLEIPWRGPVLGSRPRRQEPNQAPEVIERPRDRIRRERERIREEARRDIGNVPEYIYWEQRPGSLFVPLTPQEIFRIEPIYPSRPPARVQQPRDLPEPQNRANPQSQPNFGHTFTRHGRKNISNLRGRAGGTGQEQGVWLDDAAAAEYLGVVVPYITEPSYIPIPPGMGAVVLPNGTVQPVTSARVLPKPSGGIDTAFPVLR